MGLIGTAMGTMPADTWLGEVGATNAGPETWGPSRTTAEPPPTAKPPSVATRIEASGIPGKVSDPAG